MIDALERVPEFRRRCRERFRYLLVDEFQDTNRIQLDLIRLLSADGFGNVAVVGDAKQSIYGWRDAEIENIRSRFGGKRLPLTHNRRSYQEILDCARRSSAATLISLTNPTSPRRVVLGSGR